MLLVALATTAFAKIPEPDAIYYGKAKHNGGSLLLPNSTGDVIISAKLNGVILAQTILNAASADFVLKVPVDDGQEPRLTGMARGGERVRLYLKSVPLNVEYEATQSSSSSGLVVPTLRGDLTELTGGLTVNANFGGLSQGFAPYSVWASSYGLPSNSSLDSDRDGQTNLQEYAAGTNPLDASDNFRILDVQRANGISSIKYGPILLSREYNIWCSESMAVSSWVKIGTILPNAPAPYRWYDHVVPESTPSLFYKLSVDVQ